MINEIDSEAVARQIGMYFYPHVIGISRLKSNSNYVFRLELGNGRASKVLKIAQPRSSGGLRREQQVMSVLHTLGFAVPIIEYTQEDACFGVQFTIMPFIEGVPLDRVLAIGTSAAGITYERLGNFMHQLSKLDAVKILNRHLIEEDKKIAETAWAESYMSLLVHRRCTPRLLDIYEHSRNIQLAPETSQSLTHGDSLQLITNGDTTFLVIDWEAASAGHRLLELGYFLMAHGFSTLLQSQKGFPVYPKWRSRLLNGFTGPFELTTVQATEIHILGAASCIDDALAMSAHNLSKTDDFFSFIEEEDAAFLANPMCRFS